MFIKIEGYGVQSFAGTVPFSTYQYFEKEGINLEEYNELLESFDADEGPFNIPEEHNFAMENGSSLNSVSDLWEIQGAVLDKENMLIVEINDKPDWECDLSISTLQSHGIKLFSGSSSEQIMDGSSSAAIAIVVGTEVFKGLIFGDDEVESDGTFDPKQLEIHYHNHNEELVITNVKYAGEDLYNRLIEAETKSIEYEWII